MIDSRSTTIIYLLGLLKISRGHCERSEAIFLGWISHQEIAASLALLAMTPESEVP